jgi:hypothetical protein
MENIEQIRQIVKEEVEKALGRVFKPMSDSIASITEDMKSSRKKRNDWLKEHYPEYALGDEYFQ